MTGIDALDRLDRIWGAVTRARRFDASVREEIATLADETLALSAGPEGARTASPSSLLATEPIEHYTVAQAVAAGGQGSALGPDVAQGTGTAVPPFAPEALPSPRGTRGNCDLHDLSGSGRFVPPMMRLTS